MNVEQFAQELKLPPQLLLEQLRAAGVTKSDVVDTVTEGDKAHLLDYLRKMHGSGSEDGKTKITITRKQTGEIRKTDSTGKSRTIQVETRKKRTYVKRDAAAPTPEAPPPEDIPVQPIPEPVVEPTPVPPPVVEPEIEPVMPVEITPVVIAAPPSIEEVAPPAVETPLTDVAVPKKTTRVKKASILGEAEVKSREDEARRHTALQERQAQDAKTRVERDALKKQAEAAREAAKLAEAQKAAAPPVAAPTANTLHKPAKPAGVKADKKPAKKAGASTATPWNDGTNRKKGALKTRGGAAPDTGWRGRKNKPKTGDEETNFNAPSEPVVREVLVDDASPVEYGQVMFVID